MASPAGHKFTTEEPAGQYPPGKRNGGNGGHEVREVRFEAKFHLFQKQSREEEEEGKGGS
jgi:hypothetical protein